MPIGKINQPHNGLFALIASSPELAGLSRQIMGVIFSHLGPALDARLTRLAAHPKHASDHYAAQVFDAALSQIMSLADSHCALPDVSLAIGKARHLADNRFRLLLVNLGTHHVYLQENHGPLLHLRDQAPDIITATVSPGDRLVLVSADVRDRLTEADLARSLARMPYADATAEHLILRELSDSQGDSEILVWTAKPCSAAPVIAPKAKELPNSARLARLNDRLKQVIDELAGPHPALERLQLEMAKANLEYWLASKQRQALGAELPPLFSLGDLVSLGPDPEDEYVVHAYDSSNESYRLRQTRRRGRRHDLSNHDLVIDRFSLESRQAQCLNPDDLKHLARAAAALALMNESREEYARLKRTHDLFARQAQDLAWENRRRALRQKVRDIY